MLTLAAVLAGGWTWHYPQRALALVDAGSARMLSFLQSNPLAEFTGGLPLLNPILFVMLAALVAVMVGKLAFATRVE